MALNAVRYMQAYGATNEDFGRAVVQFREYAANNPNAHFFKQPISLDDHQSSGGLLSLPFGCLIAVRKLTGPWPSSLLLPSAPLTVLQPVLIAAAANAGLFEEEIASNHYTRDIAVMEGCAAMASRLFDGYGIKRSEVDVAMIYDAFSPIFLMQLEALGFCGPGEAKEFIADGNLGPKGSLPCNTNGGLIGEGYIHGLNLTTEAVRQLRGESANQLPDPSVALICASRTGVILRRP